MKDIIYTVPCKSAALNLRLSIAATLRTPLRTHRFKERRRNDINKFAITKTLYPYRVFQINTESLKWTCLICGNQANVVKVSRGAITSSAVRKTHTILTCAKSFANRWDAIEVACKRLYEVLKSRDKREDVFAAFTSAVSHFRMSPMPGTTCGSRDAIYINKGALFLRARVSHSVFYPVGCSVAKYFTSRDGQKHLFLGKVHGIVIAPVRNEEQLLVQVWKVKWGDGDEEQMERADLMKALALARRIRLYGPRDHEHE